jgi:prepilin-type N-terminal cleavage/methylation domain-containing protein
MIGRLQARRLAARRLQGEDGMTLVELLVAIAITGLIIGPLTAGLVIGLRTSGDTATRLAGSTEAQFLAIVLPPDIESTGSAAGDVVISTTANTECSGVTNVLRLRWTSTDTGTSTTYQAAYSISGSALAGWKLKRSFCVGAGAAVTRTIARNLANATAATSAVSGTKVAMTVTEAKAAGTPTAYTFTISANRRTP